MDSYDFYMRFLCIVFLILVETLAIMLLYFVVRG